MAALVINGRTWQQCQSEAEYRLNQYFNFSGVSPTATGKSGRRAMRDRDNPILIERYNRCVKIAAEIPCSSEVVVTCGKYYYFTCSFFTIDPENGNIDRIYWMTDTSRYYADL